MEATHGSFPRGDNRTVLSSSAGVAVAHPVNLILQYILDRALLVALVRKPFRPFPPVRVGAKAFFPLKHRIAKIILHLFIHFSSFIIHLLFVRCSYSYSQQFNRPSFTNNSNSILSKCLNRFGILSTSLHLRNFYLVKFSSDRLARLVVLVEKCQPGA